MRVEIAFLAGGLQREYCAGAARIGHCRITAQAASKRMPLSLLSYRRKTRSLSHDVALRRAFEHLGVQVLGEHKARLAWHAGHTAPLKGRGPIEKNGGEA